jgi:YfiH family protein
MSFQENNSVRFLTFSSLSKFNLPHAVFTRNYGVSKGHLRSLNLGGSVGDKIENVKANREACFQAIGREIDSVFDSWLVHGTDILVADRPRPDLLFTPPKADIIMTNKHEVTLFLRFGDCTPILFFDPIQNAIALAHGGWRGTIDGVARKTVEGMHKNFGSEAKDIFAVIGPAICVDHYEVGEDVYLEAKKKLLTENIDVSLILPFYNNRYYIDLKMANALILQESGVENVEVSDECTACNLQDWFSHRAEKGKTGRFGALLALKEG